jgi:hypothetical protein
MKNYIVIAKRFGESIWYKLKFILVIPPMIVLSMLFVPLVFFNILGLRDTIILWFEGQIPENEQKVLVNKLLQINNHFSFIFYILLLIYYVFFNKY